MTVVSYNAAEYPPGLVAVPASNMMFTESVLGILRLMRGIPPRTRMKMGRSANSSSIAFNRNALTEDFLKDRLYSWVLYLDSDMVPSMDTALRLLSHKVDVVSALYFQRGAPWSAVYVDSPSNTEPQQWRDQGLREVDYVGAGCLLVKRHVIESLKQHYEYPWEHPLPGALEDNLFCDRVREMGYKIFVDTGCVVGSHDASKRRRRDR